MTEIRSDYYKSGGMETFDVIDVFDLDFNLGNDFKIVEVKSDYEAGRQENL